MSNQLFVLRVTEKVKQNFFLKFTCKWCKENNNNDKRCPFILTNNNKVMLFTLKRASVAIQLKYFLQTSFEMSSSIESSFFNFLLTFSTGEDFCNVCSNWACCAQKLLAPLKKCHLKNSTSCSKISVYFLALMLYHIMQKKIMQKKKEKKKKNNNYKQRAQAY